MGIPATSCATALWVWPATIACTTPAGSARATAKISAAGSQLDRSAGASSVEHWPPACAATITILAPLSRSAFASSTMACAIGFIVIPPTFAAIVVVGVSMVETPMIPTGTPFFVTITDGVTFGQASRRPSSRMFAASMGNAPFAWSALALSAPRGSLSGPSLAPLRGTDASPTGP